MDKNTAKIIKELKKFKERNNIKKLIFFGSRLNNKHNQYSDIDLIVVSPRFRRLKSYKRAPLIRLNWNLNYPVDMLCYTPEEFEKKKIEPTIVRTAIGEGIEI